MKITSIDFETANASRGSACSVGIAVIEDKKLVYSAEKLIKPHASCNYFDWRNIQIHGIRPEDVEFESEFPEIKDWLFNLLDTDIVIAHNAAFDMSVLRALCNLYNYQYPEMQYLCTLRGSQKHWAELPSHKLNDLCDNFGHTFSHHNACADAEAAGLVLLQMLEESECDTPFDFADKYKIKLGRMNCTTYTPCSICKK
jgi:DNA polymerase-3 subunit epsilon